MASAAAAAAAAASSSARSLLLSRFRDPSLRSCPSSTSSPPHPLLPRRMGRAPQRVSAPAAVLCCLVSDVDGGGLADDLVSTREETGRRRRRREFGALSNVLRHIEPLDASEIGKGVSSTAKDSMKRTISTMLGLLPSDHFHVAVRVPRQPLRRLLASSIITGYTLWNAEYRLSLTRNLDGSPAGREVSVSSPSSSGCEALWKEHQEWKDGDEVGGGCRESEMMTLRNLADASPAALTYIRKLEVELAMAEKELDAQQQENRLMGRNTDDDNNLLEYLRSLQPYMVTELSQPSSLEVEEIIQQLVHNIYLKSFKDAAASLLEENDVGKTNGHPQNDINQCDSVDTMRDYLAKLLFWCMLLGHHMRGLEYRLHLSCVVGLL